MNFTPTLTPFQVDPFQLDNTKNIYGETRSDFDDIYRSLKTPEDVQSLPPIGITPAGVIIYGHRRTLAVKKFITENGIDASAILNAICHDDSDPVRVAQLAVKENEGSRKATVYEQMHALAGLVAAGLKTGEAVKEFTNRDGKAQSKTWGSMLLKTYEACKANEVLNNAFRDGVINYTLAYNLSSCDESVIADTIHTVSGLKNRKTRDGIETIQEVTQAVQDAKAEAKAADKGGDKGNDGEKKDEDGVKIKPTKVWLSSRRIGHTLQEAKKSLKAAPGDFNQESPFTTKVEVIDFIVKVLQGTKTVEGFLKK